MADVTDPGSDRAQLLLVAAFGLAVMFVAIALILNTAIYTQNLATRSSDISGGQEAIRYQESTREATAGIMRQVNYNNNSTPTTTHYEWIHRNVTNGTDDYERLSGQQHAVGGTATNLSVTTVNGTRIVQDDVRKFNNSSTPTAANDWTAVANVDNTRGFAITVENIDGATLGGICSLLDNCLNITIESGGTTWRVVFDESVGGTDELDVKVEDTSGTTTTCPGGPYSTPVSVNLTAGTVNGTECDAMDFGGSITSSYAITFNNGGQAEGTYEFITDNASVDNSHPNYDNGDTTSPYVTTAIYSTNVTLTYQSDRTLYRSEIRVAPGESDD